MGDHRTIRAFRIGNFKAFADTQRIPLKPITLIFGPNSAGKSSFIHSLALAHEAQFGRNKPSQRSSSRRLDVHHTNVGGSAIDLGGFRQYIHRGQANRRVEWGAELDVAALEGRLAQLLAPVRTLTLSIALGIELDDEDRPKPSAEPRVEAIEISGDGAELLRMSHRRVDSHGGTLRVDRIASDHAVFQQVLKAIVESATTSEEMRPGDSEGTSAAIADLLPELRIRIDAFFPTAVELPRADAGELSPVGMLFPVSKGNRKEDIAQAVRFYLPRTLNELIKGLSEVLADDLERLQYLGPLRSFPPRHLAFAEHEDANWYAGGGYAWDVVRRDDAVREAVNDWLGSSMLKTPYRLEVRSLVDTQSLLGPIAKATTPTEEAAPLDFGAVANLLDSAATTVRDKIWALASGNERRATQIERVINKWRPQLDQVSDGREKMNLTLLALAEINEASQDESLNDIEEGDEPQPDSMREAQRIVDVIQQADIATLRELVLVDIRKDTVVTHRDVGIGISQVLPVLVMAYGSRGKLLAMEQPEIHLHPALQAELGDVFIEAALGSRKNTFILETHSEHLILRLLRRIRETADGTLPDDYPPIRPEDISVICVSPDSSGSKVTEIVATTDGDFANSWPHGFFPERAEELF